MISHNTDKQRVIKRIFFYFFLVLFYLLILYIQKREIFLYKFDPNLIKKYFLSQDITHEVAGKRLFLSDSDIHISAGYLYVNWAEPTRYNFQHPPLIKYMYGLSIKYLSNPYVIQIFFGFVLISLIYLFSLKLYDSTTTAIVACFLFILDPLFIDLTGQFLLDLGQSVFLMLYIGSMLFFKKKYILHGVFLGFLSASKFWGASVFFVLMLFLYKLYRKEINLKNFFLHLLIGALVFSLFYIETFVKYGFLFNIIFYQLKILKYWFNHSITSMPLASLLLFLSGYFQRWWQEAEIARIKTWSLIWPIGFFVSLLESKRFFLKRKIDDRIIIAFMPVLYLFYLGVQAPFPRYFILVLPFFYINLAGYLCMSVRYFRRTK